MFSASPRLTVRFRFQGLRPLIETPFLCASFPHLVFSKQFSILNSLLDFPPPSLDPSDPPFPRQRWTPLKSSAFSFPFQSLLLRSSPTSSYYPPLPPSPPPSPPFFPQLPSNPEVHPTPSGYSLRLTPLDFNVPPRSPCHFIRKCSWSDAGLREPHTIRVQSSPQRFSQFSLSWTPPLETRHDPFHRTFSILFILYDRA